MHEPSPRTPGPQHHGGQTADAAAAAPRARGIVRHVPNGLTLFRLACLPVFFWLYGTEAPGLAWKSAIVMFIAAWSDVADGYIARRYHATSELGRVLDPFADRAFFLTVFIAYVYYGTMPWWTVLPVVLRDAAMLVAGALIFGRAKEQPRVLPIGRWANFVLAWSVGFFMIAVRVVAWPLYVLGATLYVVSGALYFRRHLRERRAAPRPAQPTSQTG